MSAAGVKVGTGSASLRFKEDTAKTLATIAGACASPSSAAEGVLTGLQKHAAFLSSFGTRREGAQEIMDALSPLSDIVKLAKLTVRRRRGLVVTPRMQSEIRACLAWQATKCRSGLLGVALEAKDGNPAKMAALEAHLQTRITGTPTPPPPPLAIDMETPATSPTPTFDGSSSSSSKKSAKLYSFTRAARGVAAVARVAPCSWGTAFVAARHPCAVVDPRACRLAGSGAIRCC